MSFDHNSSPGGCLVPDFGFAFNNRNFSDRVLRIEIVDHPTEANDGSTVLRVEALHISSPILAGNSPFFYKLFVNGMMESELPYVTLRIKASEEAALMELLNFMYSNKLHANTAPALLDVLVAADKFEVTSCIRHCCNLLKSLALTLESALLCLNLPPGILIAKEFQPLMDAAKHFLAARYNDVSQHREEIMSLPLAGIEAILLSDDLQVDSEDAVYDMALKWTEIHYQNADERWDILSNRLGRYIRFSYMSPQKLRKILTCDYYDKDFATKAVVDALFFKADTRHVERAYMFWPIKVVEFEHPSQHCMIFLDIKREECAGLPPSGQIYFQPFLLRGQRFSLSAQCSMDNDHCHYFKLFLGVQEMSLETFSVNYEFAARSKPLEEYMSMCSGKCDFTGGNTDGPRSLFLFSIPRKSFIADNSPYFINGVFYLRAELTVKLGAPV